MTFVHWYLVIGGVFVLMAFASSYVQRLPLTTTILYLAFGFGLGTHGLEVITVEAWRVAVFVEHLTEVAVIVALFNTGLKLRLPFKHPNWRQPIRLAFVAMTLTVACVAILAKVLLGMEWGLAILLGAILSPTDPVLASDVQVEAPGDHDRVRFTLTGEAGLNDGTAFPFVMLGLGLLGLHDIGEWGVRWFLWDVVWAAGGGLGIGALLGWLVGKLVIYIRQNHREAVGFDDFLALGLIALSYGIALLLHTYGFLAVFAAGLALRHIEMSDSSGGKVSSKRIHEGHATHSKHASAYMTHAVLSFTENIERILIVGIVIFVGAITPKLYMGWQVLLFIGLVFVAVRPVTTLLSTIDIKSTKFERMIIGWFGIRGIGSLYYVSYAINKGLSEDLAEQLMAITLCVVLFSSVIHGISVTPLMKLYSSKK